jgi:peptide/nickel transport system substrate-binding protein
VRRRSRRRGLFVAVVLAAVLAAVLVSYSGATTSSTSTASATAATNAKSFPLLKVNWIAPDHFDPAVSYTNQGWEVLWNVYAGLLGYKHVNGPDGGTVIPYLARSLPKVTNGGKLFSFTLRPNIEYSNGKPVKASDFACTIERDYQMSSGGVGFFSSIQGATAFSKLKAAQMKKSHISGIVTNDAKRTITIKLAHPEGDMLNILATEFAAFVPCGTPAVDQSTHPTPATGPYMITKYTPHQSFTLEKNPNFKSQIPGIPSGNAQKVVGTIYSDNAQAAQSVASNAADYDLLAIPTDRLASYEQKYGRRIRINTPADTFYFFLNQRYPPFNNVKAREAVNYAISRKQMVQLFGGLAVPTENILPPLYKAYKKISMFPVNGDMAKAKSLVAQSGTKGDAVTLWTPSNEPDKSLVEYEQSILNQLDYKTTLKVIDPQTYIATIENQSTKAQTGDNGWFQDYPNPIDWFDVLFNGNRIAQTNNNNVGNTNDPAINKQIEKLKTEQPSKAVDAGWAKVDRELMTKNFAAVPYVTRSSTDFLSNRMNMGCYVFNVLYQWDFASACTK